VRRRLVFTVLLGISCSRAWLGPVSFTPCTPPGFVLPFPVSSSSDPPPPGLSSARHPRFFLRRGVYRSILSCSNFLLALPSRFARPSGFLTHVFFCAARVHSSDQPSFLGRRSFRSAPFYFLLTGTAVRRHSSHRSSTHNGTALVASVFFLLMR
jgi:hypothetical protein